MEINAALERKLGVERSFWIACALAFLEYLEQRDVSLNVLVYLFNPLILYLFRATLPLRKARSTFHFTPLLSLLRLQRFIHSNIPLSFSSQTSV